MAKKATKAAKNVLYQARMEAATWNEKLSSREGAAEVTGIDRTRIAYIELGTVTPYPEEILLLSDYYNAPELMNHYCSHMCPLGKQTVEPIELKELTTATLQLLSSLRDIPEITDELVDIAEDGVIDKDEAPTMEGILRKLRQAAKKIHTLELIYQKKLCSPGGESDG